eukprot:scaffold16874_cov17-Tisochrysis_lutea.AAC.1
MGCASHIRASCDQYPPALFGQPTCARIITGSSLRVKAATSVHAVLLTICCNSLCGLQSLIKLDTLCTCSEVASQNELSGSKSSAQL